MAQIKRKKLWEIVRKILSILPLLILFLTLSAINASASDWIYNSGQLGYTNASVSYPLTASFYADSSGINNIYFELACNKDYAGIGYAGVDLSLQSDGGLTQPPELLVQDATGAYIYINHGFVLSAGNHTASVDCSTGEAKLDGNLLATSTNLTTASTDSLVILNDYHNTVDAFQDFSHGLHGYDPINPFSTIATVGAVTISPNPVQINNAVTATANFTDSGVLDTHTATIDWGDQTGTHPCAVSETNGSGSVSCSLPSGYASAKVYPVTVTVSDGIDSRQSPVAYASAYNPTAQGLFTAGQRFRSPAGAYTANSSLAGTVQFGLSYKYQDSMPTSNRQFSMDFDAANLHFNANYVNSLVVANNMATLIGTGTINGGSQTYNFLVTGVDGGGIRIQITDTSNNVIYDTQPGAAITATPTTTVNGHVIAHN